MSGTQDSGLAYLVAYVPDESGDDALALAALLAGTDADGELTVCTVVPQTGTAGDAAFGSPGYGNLVAEKMEPVFAEARERLRPLTASFTIRFAPSAARGLLDYAGEIGAFMLILGSSRSGLMGNYAMGSVGGLLQHSSPILLASAPDGYAQVNATAVTRVVCGVHAGDPADVVGSHALDTAVLLSRRFGVPLHLVHFAFPEFRHFSAARLFDVPESEGSEAQEHLGRQLSEAAESVPGDIDVHTRVCRGANVAQAVAAATWQDGDLLVLGSAPMGPIARVFLGSTALKIARCCPAPVIAIPRMDAGVRGDQPAAVPAGGPAGSDGQAAEPSSQSPGAASAAGTGN